VFPLLEGTDGKQKMSKSLGNYIGISEPPEQIYGKTMSIPDQLIEKYVRLISGLEVKQQDEVLAMKPRDAKAALARQLVKRLRGEVAAQRAEDDFNTKFRKREIPETIEEHAISGPTDIISLLVAIGIAASRNEARRLAQQGGVRINNEKVDENAQAKVGDVISARRRYIRLK
jgi:tyrosyl-tRNA synthetase